MLIICLWLFFVWFVVAVVLFGCFLFLCYCFWVVCFLFHFCFSFSLFLFLVSGNVARSELVSAVSCWVLHTRNVAGDTKNDGALMETTKLGLS